MYYGRSKSNFPVASLKRRMKRLWEHVIIDQFYEVYQSLNLIRKKTEQLFPREGTNDMDTHTYIHSSKLYREIM